MLRQDAAFPIAEIAGGKIAGGFTKRELIALVIMHALTPLKDSNGDCLAWSEMAEMGLDAAHALLTAAQRSAL